MNNLLNKEYNGYVSIDSAPGNGICEWCEEPAIHRYLVTGGIFHNQTGLFCSFCGEAFACHVEYASKTGEMRVEQTSMVLRKSMSGQEHIGVLNERHMNGICLVREEDGEEIITMEDYFRWVRGRYAQ